MKADESFKQYLRGKVKYSSHLKLCTVALPVLKSAIKTGREADWPGDTNEISLVSHGPLDKFNDQSCYIREKKNAILMSKRCQTSFIFNSTHFKSRNEWDEAPITESHC